MVVLSIARRGDRRRARVGWMLAATLAAGFLTARSAHALFLDEGRNISFRAREYNQATLATENALVYSDPGLFKAGQLVSQRNFFEPELDAKFLPFLNFSWLDDFSGRLALWGFYDGVYDYGAEQFGDRAADVKFRKTVSIAGQPPTQLGLQTKGHGPEFALSNRDVRRDTRDIYGLRYRVNEAYVNISKGPLFVRIGRQAISWGESDTIGLLDANNPFDVTVGAPGLTADLDESRIPLWTLRSTLQLYTNVGPFSSGFLDMYWVPGWLDTNTGPFPMSGVNFESTPPPNGGGQHVEDSIPKESLKNSRWGVRFQTVIARDYTTSAWFYTTFPITPAIHIVGIDTDHLVTVAAEHRLTNVIGLSSTFYSDMINAVVRSELELFNGEPGFVYKNAIGKAISSGFQQPGSITRANLLRGELGMDRNFFITALNPTNSFMAVTALVFTANLSQTAHTIFRDAGQIKPSAIKRQIEGGPQAGSVTSECDGQGDINHNGKVDCDYIGQDPFEFFVQNNLSTEYMHGRLAPSLLTILTGHGALTWVPAVDYRFSDSFIGEVKYINVHRFGNTTNGLPGAPLPTDRDQVWFRLTYQLN